MGADRSRKPGSNTMQHECVACPPCHTSLPVFSAPHLIALSPLCDAIRSKSVIDAAIDLDRFR
jgi:hypothetical protein